MSCAIKEVKKRDGRIVPFDETRIAEAIFKAAKSVGGKRKNLSYKLADKVTKILEKKFANQIPTIEDIQDTVEKVLIEEGHAKTAKTYILYRDKRSRMRQMLKVQKEVKGKVETTDLSLLVAAPSQYEISPWDKNKIVQALIKEAKVSRNMAEKIARSVEEKILALGLNKLTTSLIREFVDIELLNHGFNGKLKSQQTIGMPIYDLRELIYSKSQENSNISANNPEAINLSIAENTLKQYMLQEVFSEEVSIAHLIGLIHIHDLGYPRVYSFYRGETIFIRKNDEIDQVSLESLYDTQGIYYNCKEWEIKDLKNIEVYDKNGWVKLKKIMRHKSDKPLLFIKYNNGASIIVTPDHPMIKKENRKEEIIPAQYLKIGDKIFYSLPPKRGKVSHINLAKEFIDAGIYKDYVLKNVSLNYKGTKNYFENISLSEVKNLVSEGYIDYSQLKTSVISNFKGKETLPTVLPLSKELGWLMGFFIAEGHYEDWSLGITTNNISNLIPILGKLEIPYRLNERSDAPIKMVRIYSKLLVDLFQHVFKIEKYAYNKSFPKSFLSYNSNFCESILSGIVDGDGTLIPATNNNFYGVNVRMTSRLVINQIKALLESKEYGFQERIQNVPKPRMFNDALIKPKKLLHTIVFPVANQDDFEMSGKIKDKKFVHKLKSKTEEVEITQIKEIKNDDPYVYDIETESGTFYCNGILTHNCSSHSIEYLKKYGLVLDNLGTASSPAKHARTLTGHLNTYLASMQAYYAGALGIGFLNILYAPLLAGMSYEEMKQEAQYLLFSGSQNAFSRGGQTLFIDANIHLGVPDYLKNVPAIGPKGKYLDKTYGDFENESQMFAKALLEVWKEGDRDGHPFSFPKCDLHINAESFSNPKQYDLFKFACDVASYNGSPYFVFDRGDGATLSQCFTENTKVLIKNSSKYVYENISQIYNLMKGQEEVQGVEHWKVPPDGYYRTLGIDDNGKTDLIHIKQMLKRKYEGEIYCIKLEDGTEISVTPDHPFFVLKNGLLVRKRADQLAEGDFIPINKVTKPELDDAPLDKIDLMEEAWKQKNDKIEAVFNESLHLKTKYISEKYQISKHKVKHWNAGRKGEYRYPAWLLYNEGIHSNNAKLIYRYGHTKSVHIPSKICLSPQIGRFLGLYLAEGYTNKSAVSFSLSCEEKELVDFITKTVKGTFGSNIWFDNSKKWKSIKVMTSSRILAWFISLFIKGNSARNKELTSLVFNTTEEFKKSFIKGFLEGDGYTRQGHNTVEVSLHLGSSRLSKDIRTLLRSLGINSTIRKVLTPNPRNKKQILDSYHIRIANIDLKKIDWGFPYKGENPSSSHSLWRLLPSKEMDVNWNDVDNVLKHQLHRASRNHLDYFKKYYSQNDWSKKINNGMHFLKVKEVSHTDYNGYVYDFEVDDEKHGFLLPEGIYTSNCCRLKTKVTDPEMLKHPESLRFCGFQNVTINLPQCAYRAGRGNIDKVFEEIDKAMEIAMKAHLEKRKFIGKLMSSPGAPLWQIGKSACDGKPYVDLDKATYIIGLIGLDECVQYLTGKQLHEDDEVFKLGMKIISSMYLKTQELQKKYKLHIALEESPAESATRRLAKVDLKEFPQSKEVVKGDIKNDTYYYTNSIHFAANAPVNFLDRIIKQSKFHPIIESGAIIHAFIGEAKPSAQSIENLVRKTWENTQCAQLTISPEFTICNDCAKMDRGLNEKCSYCGSENIYGITRIVGYYSKVNNWNKSKIGELKDRQKAAQYYQFK